MFFLLALPPCAQVDLAAQALGALTGTPAIDARQILLRGAPFIAQWLEDSGPAQVAAQALRDATLVNWPLHEDALARVPQALAARSFRFENDGLWASDRHTELVLPYSDILLIARMRSDQATETVTQTTERKTNTLVMLTTGMPIGRTVTTTDRQKSAQNHYFSLVFTADAAVRLPCEGLDYGGLPGPAQASSFTNYTQLLTILAQKSPGAVVDARLERIAGKLQLQPGAPGHQRLEREGKSTKVRSQSLQFDNEDAALQAAHLLYLATRRQRAGG